MLNIAQSHVCAYVWMTRDKIVKEKYSAVFNSAVADKNRRIAEIKTPQKLPAIRYVTRKYPYTTEGDIRHKEHNWQVVQIVNTIYVTIVNSFKSNIEKNGYFYLSLLVVY